MRRQIFFVKGKKPRMLTTLYWPSITSLSLSLSLSFSFSILFLVCFSQLSVHVTFGHGFGPKSENGVCISYHTPGLTNAAIIRIQPSLLDKGLYSLFFFFFFFGFCIFHIVTKTAKC
ncbi:hypothetical protein GGR50DRAFT_507660 [Xylaria sp. CBS 124048]|nr:hypothetical protein GGR50DRAFT_507660 [Xylaria sp. CBS 124048]